MMIMFIVTILKDIEEYKISATLDLKTSSKCRKKNRQIHKVEDAVVGKSYPSFHIHCRTFTVP